MNNTAVGGVVLDEILLRFNQEMKNKLSPKGSTPGKIMHTKVFQQRVKEQVVTQVRCYFAVGITQQVAASEHSERWI